MIKLWAKLKLFYQSRIIQGIGLMILTLLLFISLAYYLATGTAIDLFRVQLLSSGTFSITISYWAMMLMVAWAGIAWWFFWPRGEPWEAAEVNVEVARIGKVVMRPNQEVAGLAHRAWSEIMTRKAGIPFDEENDVIAEVYDSWYALFGEFRQLVKSVPVDKLRRNEDARLLCDLLIRALNRVLRPHLTKYQAKFRVWYEAELENSKGLAPQEIQKRFPQYGELVQDIRATHDDFITVARALYKISRKKDEIEEE